MSIMNILFNAKSTLLSIILFSFFLSFKCPSQVYEYDTAVALSPIINSEAEESFPIYSPHHQSLFFVRTFSPRNIGGQFGGQDIWVSKITDGKILEPTNKIDLNSKGNNAIIGFNTSGNLVYLLNAYKGKNAVKKGISSVKVSDGKYTKPTSISLKDLYPTTSYYGFYMHPSEKFLLVSMQSEGTIGKEDIYIITKNDSGEWNAPVNLGPTINSTGSEISPFLSEDGQSLYFSSNGHGGLGDMDLFMSQRQYNSWDVWSKPVNLGDRINSKKFDAYFSMTRDSTIYFSSNREGGLSDIYKSKLRKKDLKKIFRIDDPNNVVDIKQFKKATKAEVDKFLGISITPVVYFKVNSAEISDGDKELIYFIAEKLDADKRFVLELIGHADQEGTNVQINEISSERAEAVKKEFVSLGIPGNRIITTAKGNSQPFLKGSAKKNDKNRRVEMNFLK